jgi:NitT/TauT family transport system substrate-binding protein
MTGMRVRRLAPIVALVGTAVLLLTLVGSAAGNSRKHNRKLATINLNGLPIANGFALDIGIAQGFFSKRGIEIKKTTFQSGNDIVLAMANGNGDVGYIGWVPAIIARSQGIPLVTISASDNEATSIDDNWQNVMVKGSSSIRTPKDLEGKTVAGNALKGVCEIVIRAALSKFNVDQSAVKFVAIPFPAMRAALNGGQVDAICAPEPFMTQAMTIDGARILLAPGPTLGKYWPNGTYVAREQWAKDNPALYKGFHDAMAESLAYTQAHPEAVRALLPAAIQNIRLPVWSSLIDRRQLAQLAKYCKEFGAISTLPNLTKLVPASISTGLLIQGDVGAKTIAMKLDGKRLTSLLAGDYTFVVSDRSARQNFHLKGPGLDKKTGTRQVGRLSFTTKLGKGVYTYSSDANPKLKGTFRVT